MKMIDDYATYVPLRMCKEIIQSKIILSYEIECGNVRLVVMDIFEVLLITSFTTECQIIKRTEKKENLSWVSFLHKCFLKCFYLEFEMFPLFQLSRTFQINNMQVIKVSWHLHCKNFSVSCSWSSMLQAL